MPFALRPTALLGPLRYVYGAGTWSRNRLYDWKILQSARSALPVMCVGNVTAGGSGKTPFVQYLAAELQNAGKKPVILSRGYGGKLPGPHLISSQDQVLEVGDEPLLHLQRFQGRVPVVISRDRVAGCKFIEKKRLGDIVLLDDGFQHRALNRDVNILLLDASTGTSIRRWAGGKLLPAGWLRESFADALKRTSCVVFTQKVSDPLPRVATDAVPGSMTAFHFRFVPRDFVDVFSQEVVPLPAMKRRQICAVTGIGSPEHFFRMMSSLETELTMRMNFPDHHQFTAVDWIHIQQTASMYAANPLVACTEKDAVKLKPYVKKPHELYFLRMDGSFIPQSDRRRFWTLVAPLCSLTAESLSGLSNGS
jgi:tetraacyldisaccharide 4'-kinase